MLAGLNPEATHSREGGMHVNETRDRWQAAVAGTIHKPQRQPSSRPRPHGGHAETPGHTSQPEGAEGGKGAWMWMLT